VSLRRATEPKRLFTIDLSDRNFPSFLCNQESSGWIPDDGPGSSFRRRPESSSCEATSKRGRYWIPACAVMTSKSAQG
jgi:hypothetical protein